MLPQIWVYKPLDNRAFIDYLSIRISGTYKHFSIDCFYIIIKTILPEVIVAPQDKLI